MHRFHRQAALLFLCVLPALIGCKRASKPAPGDEMSLIPREASILLSVNIDRMRASKLWQNAVDLRNDPANKKKYDEFVRDSGVDPLTQLRVVMIGIPSDVDTSRELAVLVRGVFNESKLVNYLRQETKRQGGAEVKQEVYAGKTIYADGKGEMYFTVLDPTLLALAGKTWIKRVIDLSQNKGTSVKNNEAVQGLLKRIKTDQAIWGGGIVPPGRVQLPSGADIKSIVANVDFAQGLRADVLAETPNPDEGKKLTDSTEAQISTMKQTPMLGMLGLTQVLDAVKASTEGSSMHVSLVLTAAQTDDLVNRLKGIAQLFASSGVAALKTGGPSVEQLPQDDRSKAGEKGKIPAGVRAVPASPGTATPPANTKTKRSKKDGSQ